MTSRKMLFEREELGSTGLKTGVAIPHAEPQTVIRTKAHIYGFGITDQMGNEPSTIGGLIGDSRGRHDRSKRIDCIDL